MPRKIKGDIHGALRVSVPFVFSLREIKIYNHTDGPVGPEGASYSA